MVRGGRVIVALAVMSLVACSSSHSAPQTIQQPCRYLSREDVRALLGDSTVDTPPLGVTDACTYQTVAQIGGPSLVLQLWRGSLNDAPRRAPNPSTPNAQPVSI